MATSNSPRPSRVPTAFEISQLHDKAARDWLRLIKELDDEKRFRAREYAPLRKAIVAELHSPGTGQTVLEAELLGYSAGKATASMTTVMLEGFTKFLSGPRKHILEIKEDFVNYPAPIHVRIEPGEVRVTPHAMISHRRHGHCGLFAHASRYSESELAALQEILLMAMEQKYPAEQCQLLWLDVRGGKTHLVKSRPRFRRLISQTVELYQLLGL